MSKIEKALSRAKTSRSIAIVKKPDDGNAASGNTSNAGRDLVHTQSGSQIAARSASASAIAGMRETTLRKREDLTRDAIIVPESGENATVQAFRELRTRLLQHTQGRNGIILVTSASSGGGSSFVAINLGVAFAFDAGRTALLVDCNLRSPHLQNLLQNHDGMGITDFLDDSNTELESIIHSVGIERLRVIPAGRKRDIPTEYFTSVRVRNLFDDIRARYAERMIILDAPPMTESADTQILAELCDHVLLIVPYGQLTPTQIDRSIKSIDQKKLIGVVLNNEPQLPPLRFSIKDAAEILQQAGVNAYNKLLERVKRLFTTKKKPTNTTE